jgi:hypothetical protein
MRTVFFHALVFLLVGCNSYPIPTPTCIEAADFLDRCNPEEHIDIGAHRDLCDAWDRQFPECEEIHHRLIECSIDAGCEPGPEDCATEWDQLNECSQS